MHLHNYRCFQEYLRMYLQSLRELCLASEGSGSIQKYLEAQVRLPGVTGRIACSIRTDLHFADKWQCCISETALLWLEVLPFITGVPSCSPACHQCSQSLWRSAEFPSQGLILSWNWRIQVYPPHPLRYSWRLTVTKIHFADVVCKSK